MKLLFVLIIILRIVLSFQHGFSIDIANWEAWTQRLVSVGPPNFYSTNYFTDYLPGYLYILWIGGGIFSFIFHGIGFNNFLFEFFLKLITTAFDIGTAYFIYKIVKKYNASLSSLAAIFYLANPAVVFNSNIWGQIDAVPTFFAIVSAYYLLEKKDKLKWSFLTVAGILIKPQSFVLLPVILFSHFRMFKKIQTFKNLLLFTFLMFVFSFPFFPNDPLLGLPKLLLKSVEVYPYSSVFAFNLWGLFGWWKSDSITFFSISEKSIGLILYALSLLLIFTLLLKNKTRNEFLYIALSLSFFSFYFFPTRIHERYLFPYLAFLLVATLVNKSKFLIVSYFASSFIHLINLWYVYYFYNYVYKNSQASVNIFYNLIDSNYKILILLLFLFFAGTFWFTKVRRL